MARLIMPWQKKSASLLVNAASIHAQPLEGIDRHYSTQYSTCTVQYIQDTRMEGDLGENSLAFCMASRLPDLRRLSVSCTFHRAKEASCSMKVLDETGVAESRQSRLGATNRRSEEPDQPDFVSSSQLARLLRARVDQGDGGRISRSARGPVS